MLGYSASAFWWILFPAQQGHPWFAVAGIGCVFVYMFLCCAAGHAMSGPPTPTTGDVALSVSLTLVVPPLVDGVVSLHLMAMH